MQNEKGGKDLPKFVHKAGTSTLSSVNGGWKPDLVTMQQHHRECIRAFSKATWTMTCRGWCPGRFSPPGTLSSQ